MVLSGLRSDRLDISMFSCGFNLMKTFINSSNSFKTSDLLFYLGSIKDDLHLF